MTAPKPVEVQRATAAEDVTCVDCRDDIWRGEPVYQAPAGPRCLICQAQIVPWVADEQQASR